VRGSRVEEAGGRTRAGRRARAMAPLLCPSLSPVPLLACSDSGLPLARCSDPKCPSAGLVLTGACQGYGEAASAKTAHGPCLEAEAAG